MLIQPRAWSAGAALVFVLFAVGAAHAIAPVERIVLPNGLVVLVSEEHSLPFVTMDLIVDAGSWRDPPERGGLANLTAESMLLGTRQRPATEINEVLDYLGTSLDISCGWDYSELSIRSLKKELDRSFGLFMEVLTRPEFPEAEVQREKKRILGNIEAEKEDPSALAQKRFREALFVKSPYGHPVAGTEETVPDLTREMVREFYRKYYRPKGSILAVVGDITVQEVKDELAPLLSAWKGAEPPRTPVETVFADGPKNILIDRPITQANIVLGNGGIERSNPDYYAVTVMNRILGGGGFSSRLLETIRVQKGLAYSVYTNFLAHKFPGSFQLVLQTKNESASLAIQLALEEMERLKKEMVSEEELETAKKYLIGSFPLRLNTQSKLAAFLAQVEYYDLGLDYPDRYPSLIRSVTREDVLRVAKEYLHPDNYILSIVGNLQEIDVPPEEKDLPRRH
jgi:zinc protease